MSERHGRSAVQRWALAYLDMLRAKEAQERAQQGMNKEHAEAMRYLEQQPDYAVTCAVNNDDRVVTVAIHAASQGNTLQGIVSREDRRS